MEAIHGRGVCLPNPISPKKEVKNVEKAYKYRIYPNEKQKEIIAKTFGCCRFVYNKYLAQRIELY